LWKGLFCGFVLNTKESICIYFISIYFKYVVKTLLWGIALLPKRSGSATHGKRIVSVENRRFLTESALLERSSRMWALLLRSAASPQKRSLNKSDNA
jgi:hypothetical protein